MKFNNRALTNAALQRRIDALYKSQSSGVAKQIPAADAKKVMTRIKSDLSEAIAERNARPTFRPNGRIATRVGRGLLSPAALTEGFASKVGSDAMKRKFMEQNRRENDKKARTGRGKTTA